MRPTRTAAIGLVLGLVMGLVLGRLGLGPDAGGEPVVALLEAELDRERAVGDELRERVEMLEATAQASARLAAELASAEPAAAVGGDVEAAAAGTGEAAEDDVDGAMAEADEAARAAAGGFDEARLLELGFHPSDVERLRRAWESLELDRLFVQNERARSKKKDGRHWLRLRELENDLLAELGEHEFDALLYASGSKNRVHVAGVLSESPAESAGFAVGDQILEYDGDPIFRNHALKNRTTQCEMGTNVSVTVLRDGAERRIWAPCGPLGVQLDLVQAPPR